jgi:hypothetical protein
MTTSCISRAAAKGQCIATSGPFREPFRNHAPSPSEHKSLLDPHSTKGVESKPLAVGVQQGARQELPTLNKRKPYRSSRAYDAKFF